MTTFLQTILSAVVVGSVYGLLAVGFSLSYKTTGIINFAHGGLAVLAAYVAVELVSADAPLVVAVLAGVLVGAAAGGLMERVILRPLYGRPIVAGILVTVGAAVVLESVVQLVWGSTPRGLPSLVSSDPWHLGSVSVSPSQLAVLVVALVVGLGIVGLIEHTRVGRALRGCAQDSEAVSLLGVPPQRLYLLSFAVAGGLAGLAGVLIAPDVGLIPTRGLNLTVLGFAAAVLGGLGSLPGALLGGVLLAVLRTLAAVYVSADYADAVTYLAIILVLLVRVRGLLGDDVETLRRV